MKARGVPAKLLAELGGQRLPDGFVRVFEGAYLKVVDYPFAVGSYEIRIWFSTASPQEFFRSRRFREQHDVAISCDAPPDGVDAGPLNSNLPGVVWTNYFGTREIGKDQFIIMEKINEKLRPILEAGRLQPQLSMSFGERSRF